MTHEEIRITIAVRMATWNDAPIAWDGQPSSQAVLDAQANKTPWIRLIILPGAPVSPSKGSQPEVRRTGLVSAQVFTAENSGTRQSNLIVDSLVAHLEFWRTDGIELFAATPNRIGPSDGYYQVNVQWPFTAQ